MPINDENIREFLLGSASARDENEIGVSLISDEEFGRRVEHAESELIEDHLDGVLSDTERSLFYKNFLVSPQRRELMRDLKMIREGVRKASAASPPAAPKATVAKAPKFSFFSFFSQPMFAVAALVLLLLAGGIIWYAAVRDGRTPLEIEYAAINRRDLADPARTENLTVISLAPSNFRDAAATARQSASRLTGSVVFRLALPAAEPEGAELPVSIERSGKRVFTVPGRVVRNAFGSELRFLAPKEILTPGQYEVVVRSSGETSVKGTFQIRIE